MHHSIATAFQQFEVPVTVRTINQLMDWTLQHPTKKKCNAVLSILALLEMWYPYVECETAVYFEYFNLLKASINSRVR